LSKCDQVRRFDSIFKFVFSRNNFHKKIFSTRLQSRTYIITVVIHKVYSSKSTNQSMNRHEPD